jgi:hypothetical protein
MAYARNSRFECKAPKIRNEGPMAVNLMGSLWKSSIEERLWLIRPNPLGVRLRTAGSKSTDRTSGSVLLCLCFLETLPRIYLSVTEVGKVWRNAYPVGPSCLSRAESARVRKATSTGEQVVIVKEHLMFLPLNLLNEK